MTVRLRPARLGWLQEALGVAALVCNGCISSPTPLAPGLTGSVGVPHHGIMTLAEELPQNGPGFRRFREYGEYNWGHPRLIKALLSASAEVAESRPGGAPLIIGDLSAHYGGRIPRHNSHRTGRDVDLLWFVTTPQGAPVPNPGFVRIGGDGLGRLEPDGEYVRLDIARQWLLVRALLQDEQAQVQLLFCSNEIEALLIEYARARGEPDSLVWKAESVLMQPGDSLPHDDHMHLRIACTPEEAVAGCEGGGPYWQWLRPMPSLDINDPNWLRELVLDAPATNGPAADAPATDAHAPSQDLLKSSAL
ncbi:MAG TPA: penicillin-insensitive murein endopeptidase [Polyangiaceae bacterium]|nr:penicillin-insensitive murein endopeptidase [Polyangiaceae bacterium]